MQRSSTGISRAGTSKKANSRSSSSNAHGWTLSDGDVAFKDAIMAPAPRRISRTKLDDQVANRCAKRNTPEHLAKVSLGGKAGRLTGLQKACMRVITANPTHPSILERLQHVTLPPNMLERLLRRLFASGEDLPFATWRALIRADALAGSTYRGLVLDDVRELQSLGQPATAIPIAALLDLSDTVFQRDFHTIRAAIGSTLAALRLDGLQHIDDDCVADLARTAEQSQLQILCLKGCKRITDRSATKLAQYSSLRMLGTLGFKAALMHGAELDMPDLRKTSCTTATKDTLRKAHKPPYISAMNSRHSAIFAEADLATVWRTLNAVLSSPFQDSTECREEEDTQTAVLITHLTRLDESKLRDPRDAVIQNPFHSSSATFGNVWTTQPIDVEKLAEQKLQNRSEGAPRQESTMKGQLRMSRFDLGWRRQRQKAREGGQAVQEENVSDDSDLEVAMERSTAPLATPSEVSSAADSSFYSRTTAKKAGGDGARTETVPPDPLMLLRLVSRQKKTDVNPSAKRVAVNDDRPLMIKRPKLVPSGPINVLALYSNA